MVRTTFRKDFLGIQKITKLVLQTCWEKKSLKVFSLRFNFQERAWHFNVGGQLKKMDEEHSSWSGGLWGFIDRFGNIVIEPKSQAYMTLWVKHCGLQIGKTNIF